MDFDFGIGKKSQARTGRRAKSSKSNASMNSNEKESAAPKTLSAQPQEMAKESPPRPSRRMGGWGDAGGKKGKDKAVEDFRLLVTGDSPKTRIDSSDEDEKEIQVIPDLDDFQGEDISQQMAAPPSVAMNQVATYRELDSDLQRHSSFTLLDNEIDLKLLAKHMSPESEIREDDETWDWDRLFTQVSSGLKSQPRVQADTQDQLI